MNARHAHHASRAGGFTLIELLVTIMLVSIMAAMVVPYFSSGVTRGLDPLTQINTPIALQTIMANIVADYNSSATYMHDLNALNNNITTGRYGITASYTLVKNDTYKFNAADLSTALMVSIRDNATGQIVTYIFTKQL